MSGEPFAVYDHKRASTMIYIYYDVIAKLPRSFAVLLLCILCFCVMGLRHRYYRHTRLANSTRSISTANIFRIMSRFDDIVDQY